MNNEKTLHMIAFVMVVIGGLNWGAVGLLNVNFVTVIFGNTLFATMAYLIIGLSAIYLTITHFNDCKTCLK